MPNRRSPQQEKARYYRRKRRGQCVKCSRQAEESADRTYKYIFCKKHMDENVLYCRKKTGKPVTDPIKRKYG